ncbi:PRC-barrel domain-containing protein [Elioraea tepidiphila]|uniref:PRC-barrel domain-containing protein n=1 Tax=Elioraea tepidiphila TaxID=457934 RepID=UPI000375D9F2|nr:PRC-barrel domain-containing protein [Elioraea tepidiphila]
MRLNDTIRAMLLAGVIVSPALAQQTTTDPAAPAMPGQPLPERVAPPTPPAAMPATPATPSQAMPAAPRAADPAAVAASGMRASKVVGATVRNGERESIGSIDDLIITPDERVPVAVLSVGGFLGIGAKLVAVPFERLQIDREGNVTLPGATRDSLRELPAFEYPA